MPWGEVVCSSLIYAVLGGCCGDERDVCAISLVKAAIRVLAMWRAPQGLASRTRSVNVGDKSPGAALVFFVVGVFGGEDSFFFD